MWGPQRMANWKGSGKWPIFVRQNTDHILQKLIAGREWKQGVLQCSVQPALTFTTSVQLRNFFMISMGICRYSSLAGWGHGVYGNPFELCTETQLKNGSQPICKLFWHILTLILPTITPTSTVQDVYKHAHTILQAFIDTNKALPLASKISRKARRAK